MELQHEFTIPVPVDQAWPVLLDVERVAPCMPGATLESVDGDEFTGRLRVKVGPITVTYRGTARFSHKDEQAHKVTIEGSGKEARGSGTASATVDTQLSDEGGSTRVTVHTNLNVTGRPAQFGRNVMAEVGGKLVDQFAECLAEELGSGGRSEAAAGGGAGSSTAPVGGGTDGQAVGAPQFPSAAGPSQPPGAAAGGFGSARPTRPRNDAIDLLDVAGGPVLKRLAPVLGGVAALFVLLFALRRRRRRRS
ncbi:MAG: carbon monoxide dehydrogenase [Streptosporangiales bacterium]|nr:carbon monoxide dehydrogenase [Streptosporangiales bacterium]